MSRTRRRGNGRGVTSWPVDWTSWHPEQTHRPGCGVCSRDRHTRRQRRVQSRRQGKAEAMRQLDD